MDWSVFVQRQLEGGASLAESAGLPSVASFGEPPREYELLSEGPALVDRSYRGLLEISGRDRAQWLHNLTTQDVNNLRPGEGTYAFALNHQGRILFDLNILVQGDVIWVDLDRRFMEVARRHFDKHMITEDIRQTDRTRDFVRFGLVGEKVKNLLAELGVDDAATMPRFGTHEMNWSGVVIPLFRHDFCGLFAVELLVPADHAVDIWKALSDASRAVCAVPVGYDAVQVRRIEAALPWPFHEITEEYLPAEIGQADRAVSFTKGCYLGQEVVERMRSRGIVARRLVGVAIEGQDAPPRGAELVTEGGKRVGILTSVCHSFARGCVIGLGYVKPALAVPGTSLCVAWVDRSVDATVTGLSPVDHT